MQVSQCFRKSFVIKCQAAEACRPLDATLDYLAAGQQDESAISLWQFDHLQADAMRLGLLFCRRAGVTLINEGQFNCLTRHRFNLRHQLRYLRAVLLVGSRDTLRQHKDERVHGQMYFAVLTWFGSIIARSATALRRGLDGAAVEDGRRRLSLATRCDSQQLAQMMHDNRKHAYLKPPIFVPNVTRISSASHAPNLSQPTVHKGISCRCRNLAPGIRKRTNCLEDLTRLG